MSNKYQDWIDKHVDPERIRGQCREITKQMETAFPDLTRVRGHYHCPIWGPREHWWLKTADQEVVDPTASQFPSRGIGHYEERDESQPEPTGICPECGDYCFDGDSLCSEKCQIRYMAYLNGGPL